LFVFNIVVCVVGISAGVGAPQGVLGILAPAIIVHELKFRIDGYDPVFKLYEPNPTGAYNGELLNTVVLTAAVVGRIPTIVFKNVGTDCSGLNTDAFKYLIIILVPDTENDQLGVKTLVLKVNVVFVFAAAAIVPVVFTDVATTLSQTILSGDVPETVFHVRFAKVPSVVCRY